MLINLNTSLFIILIIEHFLLIKIYAVKEVFNILIKEPELINGDIETWKERYQTLIGDYFKELSKDNPRLKNVELEFEFYEYDYTNDYGEDYEDYEYYKYTDYQGNGLWDSVYDMFIMDDRFLFNDVAIMETDLCWFRLTYNCHIINYSNYIEEKDIDYHNPRVLEDGSVDNKLFGLPYEIDFDILYYHDQDKSKSIVNNIENSTWDDVLESIRNKFNSSESSFPLKISLNTADDLLNLFVEYTSNYYNLSKETDSKYYEIFFKGEKAVDLFNSFSDFVTTFSGNNVTNVLDLTKNDNLISFINGDSVLYKDKASNFNDMALLENVSSTLLPKHSTALREKFIVLNKLSLKKHDALVDAALILSSKEMQLFKAKHFNIIPTFDPAKKEVHSEINSYCQENSKICQYIEQIKPINMRKVLSAKYGPSYFESELLLPNAVKNFLEDNNTDDITFIFRSNFLLSTQYLGFYGILSIIITAISVVIGFIVMFLVYKLRDIPYIKVTSPIFCNMIIFGCIMHLFKIISRLPPYYRLKPKLFVLYSTISTNFIYIPMFAVTCRIYMIFNSERIIAKPITNKILFIFTVVLMLANIIYRIIMLYHDTYFYIPMGSILESRFPIFNNTLFDLDYSIYETYFYVIVSIFKYIFILI